MTVQVALDPRLTSDILGGVILMVYENNSGNLVPLAVDQGDSSLDSNNVRSAYLRTKQGFGSDRNSINMSVFWNAANVGAGAQSAVFNGFGQFAHAQVYVNSNAAGNFTVQVSGDGVTWFDLTQDNAGTIFTVACVASHLTAARDLPGSMPAQMRLISVSAITNVTAGVILSN